MLKREILIKRLKKRKQFLEVAAEGRKAVALGLVLQAKKSAEPSEETTPTIHLGFTVTKKIGNAVTRNFVKRRLRALANEYMPQVAKAGYDYVIIGRKAATNRDYSLLLKDLKYTLHETDTFHRVGD